MTTILSGFPFYDLCPVQTILRRNAASIFTGSGKAARSFKYSVQCGNIGINVGVAAPMAFFPFAGMKESFFGALHAQGRDGIDFFTDRNVVYHPLVLGRGGPHHRGFDAALVHLGNGQGCVHKTSMLLPLAL